MAALLRAFLSAHGRLLDREMARACSNPREAQRQFLLRLLHKNRRTSYGRMCRFASITSEEEFRTAVAVIEYADLAPYIEEIKKGKQNVLTAEAVIALSQTSGTTAEPKLIPMTPAALRLCAAPVKTLAISLSSATSQNMRRKSAGGYRFPDRRPA